MLEGVRKDIEGDDNVKSNADCTTDQDDELHLIDTFDDFVDPALHHDAGHAEVEVEKHTEEEKDDDEGETDVHCVDYCVA